MMETTSADSNATDKWFLNVVTLRSGAVLALDEIAEQPPEQRPMTMATILFQAAERDPAIGEGLMARNILPKLQQDTLSRTQAARARAAS